MTKFCYPYFRANLNRMLLRSLLISAISTVGLVAGLVPDLSRSSSNLVFSPTAYAQDVSEPEVSKYAMAVLEAEPVRETALKNIREMTPPGQDVPEVACYKKDTLEKLAENARDVALKYCSNYESIVKKYFGSFEEFNQITKNVQRDPNLKKRIQDEMLRLQNSP